MSLTHPDRRLTLVLTRDGVQEMIRAGAYTDFRTTAAKHEEGQGPGGRGRSDSWDTRGRAGARRPPRRPVER